MTTLPIARPGIWGWYTDATKCIWNIEEVSLSTDIQHYETRLTSGEKRFVKHVLAFFAASDGIVNVNIVKRFRKDIDILEAKYFYDLQVMMENVHAHMYSVLLETIIPDKLERHSLLNAAETMPIIKKLSDYMHRCIASDAPYAERLLRMACVEGIFFTGCFCAIYWLQGRGLMPALGHSNELIARDEALHTMFAMFLYTMIEPGQQLAVKKIHDILHEAVNLATEFINEALPVGLLEMNAGLMIPYIQSQADNLLALIDMDPLYNAQHEFRFMEQQNLTNRTNFFERRASEYNKRHASNVSDFGILEDF